MKSIKALLSLLMALYYLIGHAQTVKLTRQVKSETVENIAASLKENYIYLDTAIRMGNFIRQQLNSGSYDTITMPEVFASRLTTDLLSIYHDGHLSVSYAPAFTNVQGKTDTALERSRMLKFRKRVNFGFDKAEILPGNIGYLKIGGFFEPDPAAKAMTLAAFRFVSNSESLIIDLRNNMGGDPRMVSFICGFFFDRKTHLNDLYSRKDGSTTAYWAIPDTTLTTLQTTPIYILTSSRTFSAGEELSYDLQMQKRALIVGEITGGGAHPVQPFPVGQGFIANVPYARAVNPVSGTDWESIGIKPDKSAPADLALEAVLDMIGHK